MKVVETFANVAVVDAAAGAAAAVDDERAPVPF